MVSKGKEGEMYQINQFGVNSQVTHNEIFSAVCYFFLILLMKQKQTIKSSLHCFSESDFQNKVIMLVTNTGRSEVWCHIERVSVICIFGQRSGSSKFFAKIHLKSAGIFISVKITLLVLRQNKFITEICNFRKYLKAFKIM